MPVAARRPNRVEYISGLIESCWLQLGRGAHQAGDLIRPIDVWSSPFEHPAPEGIGCRYLMADIFGLQGEGEASDREQPVHDAEAGMAPERPSRARG